MQMYHGTLEMWMQNLKETGQKRKLYYYAVIARSLNTQETEDYIVDSVGMSTLFLSDIQYCYHDLEPYDVINYAVP